MAKYQETTRREDTVQKRPIDKFDIALLKSLQHEMNTQDTMGNCDPRFWVIVDEVTFATSDDLAEQFIMYNPEGAQVATSLAAAIEYAKQHPAEIGDLIVNIEDDDDNPGAYIATVLDLMNDGDVGRTDDIRIETMADLRNLLQATYLCNHSIVGVKIEQQIVPDTLFLTHAGAEAYLKKYAYRFNKNAHAYAMTADANPIVSSLWALIQTVNWDDVADRLQCQPLRFTAPDGESFDSIDAAIKKHCTEFLKRTTYGECKGFCPLHGSNYSDGKHRCAPAVARYNPKTVAERIGYTVTSLAESPQTALEAARHRKAAAIHTDA